MKILITRSVGIRGHGFPQGEVVDVEEGDAKVLIGFGKAVVAQEEGVFKLETTLPAAPEIAEPKKTRSKGKQ